jgi:hypothetical protein
MLTNRQAAAWYYARKNNREAVLENDLAQPGWGLITFSVNPSSGDTVTLGGSIVTFGTNVMIGANLITTLANLMVYLLASNDPNIKQAKYSVEIDTLLILSDNHTMTIAASAATVSHATLQLQQNRQRVPL